MIEDKYLTVHDYLKEIMSVPSLEKLEEITARYREELGELDHAEKVLWEDSVILGKELVYLKTGTDDEMGRGLLATLNETELEELKEADRIIDDNLFGYHFQPIVSVTTGEIFSYEALMRPRSDILDSPLQILKYAKLRNRLNDIERATFLNVLKIVDHKSKFFHGKRVFINSIPKTRFTEEDQGTVNELLMRHNRTVVVELTERAELDDKEFAEFKERYRALNIQTAIDDYGSGYSNVQNLLRYMPNYVKIDRSLLSGMQDDPKKRHFVREIIEFCHSNGIMALAEGVETREEMNTVIRLGVDLIQGFYTARPNERFLDEIDRDVKNEITSLNLQTVESRQKKTYIVDKEQEIMLMPLVTTEHYTEFVINRRELSFVGNPRIPADVLIRVPDNTVTTIHLRRVSLDSYQRHPCIEIGNNCDVTISVEGTAVMNRKGIRVPESSRLTITGEGKLTIYGTGDRAYGIGGDSTQTIGRITVNMGGEINLKLDGKDCVGIGGGYSNEKTGGISFENCKNLYLTISGERALGIGIANNTAPVMIRNTRIKTEINADKACGIGSIVGETDVTLKDAKINHTSSGDTQTAVGSLGSKPVKVTLSHVEMQTGIKAKTCVAIGCRDGSADIRIEGSELNLKCEGAEIVGIGTKKGQGRGRFERSVFNTALLSADCTSFGYEQENMSFLGCTI